MQPYSPLHVCGAIFLESDVAVVGLITVRTAHAWHAQIWGRGNRPGAQGFWCALVLEPPILFDSSPDFLKLKFREAPSLGFGVRCIA